MSIMSIIPTSEKTYYIYRRGAHTRWEVSTFDPRAWSYECEVVVGWENAEKRQRELNAAIDADKARKPKK